MPSLALHLPIAHHTQPGGGQGFEVHNLLSLGLPQSPGPHPRCPPGLLSVDTSPSTNEVISSIQQQLAMDCAQVLLPIGSSL